MKVIYIKTANLGESYQVGIEGEEKETSYSSLHRAQLQMVSIINELPEVEDEK